MNPIRALAGLFSRWSRQKRGKIFYRSFMLTSETKILDFGSQDGSHIASILATTDVEPKNVYIADIDENALLQGQRRYGFTPILLPESLSRYPFPDKFFDVVFCSSVIEHVTMPKNEVWELNAGKEFYECSFLRQKEFAREIMRMGKGYFVQTPDRCFPIESHTWLPFVGWMPRAYLIRFLKFSNRFWVKRTSPDWNLLNRTEMAELFPDARIVEERFLGMTKSVIAIKTLDFAGHQKCTE